MSRMLEHDADWADRAKERLVGLASRAYTWRWFAFGVALLLVNATLFVHTWTAWL